MIKIISITSFPIILLYVFIRTYSENNIYTPDYKLILSDGKFEIRNYNKINLISTSNNLPYKEATYSGFRVLANYIFGNNEINQKIPMTAPVITSMPNENKIDVSFIIDPNYSINNMPIPNTNRINFSEIALGKTLVVKFGGWATEKKINKMKIKLEKYLLKNSIEYTTKFFVAQYNSPWILPPFRKNEIMVPIN